MNRTVHSPKLTPAERAHVLVMKQEARAERLMRLIEERMNALEKVRQTMEGEVYYKPAVLHHHGTQWECAELQRINATRPASRICFCLPASAYEGKRHVV